MFSCGDWKKVLQLLHIKLIALIQLTSVAKFEPTTQEDFISGGHGVIHCRALGNPAPQFKWSRKDGRSLQGGRFIPLANGSLMVKSIQRADKGVYTCTIHQARGSESTSEKSLDIDVKVIGKIRKKYRYINVINHQYKVKEQASLWLHEAIAEKVWMHLRRKWTKSWEKNV